MRKTFSIVAALVFIIAACLIGPVAADTVVVNSVVSPSFSMTVTPGTQSFPLIIVGENTKLDGNAISVTSNGGFSISVADANTGAGVGHMRAFDGSSTIGAPYLTNPFQVAVNGNYIALTGTNQQAYTQAGGGVYNTNLKFKQVTTFADAPLPAGWMYQIGVVITGAANP